MTGESEQPSGKPSDEFALGGDWRVKLVKAGWESNPDRVVARILITNCSNAPLSLYGIPLGEQVIFRIQGLANDLRGDQGGWTWLDMTDEERQGLVFSPEHSREMSGSWRFRDVTQPIRISVVYSRWTTISAAKLVSRDGEQGLELPGDGRVHEYRASWELLGSTNRQAREQVRHGGQQDSGHPVLSLLREIGRESRAALLAVKRAFAGPADLDLYMSRVRIIRDEVLERRAAEFETLLAKTTEINVNEHPRDAESLYSKAFNLFRECHKHYLASPPGEYEYLVTWKYEYTGKGTSRPSVDEALLEAFILDIYEDYLHCLSAVAEQDVETQTYVAARTREVEDQYEVLFRNACLTLRSSLWKEAKRGKFWDPIRDTEFYRRVVMKDPNFEDDGPRPSG